MLQHKKGYYIEHYLLENLHAGERLRTLTQFTADTQKTLIYEHPEEKQHSDSSLLLSCSPLLSPHQHC